MNISNNFKLWEMLAVEAKKFNENNNVDIIKILAKEYTRIKIIENESSYNDFWVDYRQGIIILLKELEKNRNWIFV